MHTITHVFLSDYDDDGDGVGEVEAMFSESGELLGTWSTNDANWRTEYFSGFLEKLGIRVQRNRTPTPEQIKAIRAEYGYE